LKHGKVSEAALGALVEAFYGKVREDALIGPVFNGAIDDWPEHLDKLQAFWSSVMLGTGRYKGRPMPAHIKHASAISAASFERWLALWGETTDALFEPEPAAVLQDKAARIAESLAMGMAFHRDRAAALGVGSSPAPRRWTPAEQDQPSRSEEHSQ
jgi:hemoglobin